MIIEASQVRGQPRQFKGTEPAAILELEQDPLVRSAGDVQYSLQAMRVGSELLVRGSLAAELTCRCSRCGEWFPRTVRVRDITHAYTVRAENESIDLTPDIREDILLILPMSMVCSAACKGLCPTCGANRNQASCACRRQAASPAWHALDRLTLK